ncbi:MAG: hypothetical protein LBV30_05145, partial [Propionibacteriaceae bacterium]|nr:hypothetical protein [Propionibacteriaceae bacterium]
MIRKEDIMTAVPEKARQAADQGAAAWEDVVERVTPLLHTAAERLTPVAEGVKVTAQDAKRHAAGFAADTVERLQPGVNQALAKVAP